MPTPPPVTPIRPDQEADSEALCRALFESTLDAILIADDDGQYVDANLAACALFGLERAALLGLSPASFAPPEQGPAVAAAWQDFLRRGEMSGEYTLLRPDGETRELEYRARANFQPGRHLSVLRDITERKQAERALRDNEQLFRALVEQSGEVVSILDARGVARYESASVEALLGYRPEDLIGRSQFELLHPDDLPRIQALFERNVGRPGATISVEYRYRHKDGSWRWLESTTYNLLHDPVVAGIVINSHDCTARKQAEARQEFLARASLTLATSLDEQAMPAEFAALAVPFLADLCLIWLVDEDGRWREPVAHHADPAMAAAVVDLMPRVTGEHGPIGTDTLARALEAPRLMPALTEDGLRQTLDEETTRAVLRLGIQSFMVVPVVARGRPLGLLACFTAESGRRLTADDLSLAEELARRVAIGLDNERLYRAAERARAEAEEQRARLHRLIMRAPTPIAILRGPEHVFELANEIYLDAVGPRQVIGRPARQVLPELVDQGFPAILDRVYTTGETFYGEDMRVLVDRRGTGELDEALFTFYYQPLLDVDGSVEGIIVHAIEVTSVFVAMREVARLNAELSQTLYERSRALVALRETQAQVTQAGKLAAVGTLAAGVAHELNNPLMVIRGQAQMALDKVTDERQRRGWERVERQTDRMMQVIDHLRVFGRKSSEGATEPVDLNQVTREVLLFIETQLRDHNIELTLDLAEPAPVATANANEVEQVLLNLLVNARDALEPGGGAIVLRSWRDAAGCHLSVADTGPGIADHVQPRLFEPFFTTKEVGKGTGLGLSISRDLARKWSGELTVTSRTDRRGAVATLTLPVWEGA